MTLQQCTLLYKVCSLSPYNSFITLAKNMLYLLFLTTVQIGSKFNLPLMDPNPGLKCKN